jgi:hypothetical protein
MKPLKSTNILALVLFLTTGFISTGATAQMRQVFVDNLRANNNIHKISFISPAAGFVAFTNWIGYTTDSGRTFSKRYITNSNVNYNGYSVNLTFGFGISGIKAFSADTLIAYGNYGFVPAILYSTDGGNSYTLIYQSALNAQQLTNGITDMVFPQNTAIGYAVEADRIIKTTNRGKNWNIILSDPNSFYNFSEAVDDNTIFAVSQSKVMKTTNGGTSWQQLNVPSGQINYAFFRSANKGWLNIQDNGGVYYTADGGTTWSLKNIPDLTSLFANKLKFTDDSTGYATVGAYTVYKTSDSGKIWQPLPRDNSYSYLGYGHTDLFFYSATQFWAGGGQGFLELSTNAGGRPLPLAFFTIDTSGLYNGNVVHLINDSKPGYQYNWYKNGTLIGTTYNAITPLTFTIFINRVTPFNWWS